MLLFLLQPPPASSPSFSLFPYISHPPPSLPRSPQVAYTSALSLLNLTLKEADRTGLIQGNGVFTLFSLTTHPIIHMREAAAKALARMTMDVENQVGTVGVWNRV